MKHRGGSFVSFDKWNLGIDKIDKMKQLKTRDFSRVFDSKSK